MLVAHTCNPSYSEGKDQEDRGLKSAWENSSRDPILKIPNTHKKKAGGVAQVVECLPSKYKAMSSNSRMAKK
jgi:hypothetical protein